MTQPEALRLADALWALMSTVSSNGVLEAAAAELRRLYDLADKYKWQVIDTCARAEKAETQRDALLEALRIAEAALSDIGDADREPGDDVAWCEARAAEAIPQARAAIAKAEENT